MDLEDSLVLGEWVECKVRTIQLNNQRNKSIQCNTTISSELIRKPPLMKFVKLSERKLLNSILTKVVILTNLSHCRMHMMSWPILKKDNYMTSMVNRVSKLADHQVAQASIFLICSKEEDKLAQEKESQGLFL